VNLFGQRKVRWEQQWASYPGNSDGQLAMYLVDLGAVDNAPVGGLPTRLEVSVQLPETDDDGGTDTGWRAVETELAKVTRRYSGAYVGRMLTAGTARFTCYLPGPPAEPLALGGPLPTETRLVDDPNWEYLGDVLAPDDRQRHVIADLSLVHELADQGDQLGTARPVEHLGYFPGPEPAEAAATELRARGFEVNVGPDDEGEYALEAVRVDPVAPPDLHELTWTVRGSVERHGGVYDGWGCIAVK
jgi:hypothetical protein